MHTRVLLLQDIMDYRIDPVSMQMHADEVAFGTVDSWHISLEPAFELIVDVLLYLCIHGVTAHSASCEALKVYAQLVFPITNFLGLGSTLGSAMKQAPTLHTCYLTCIPAPCIRSTAHR